MSIEQYHFRMVHQFEGMTRAERLAADERSARVAEGLWSLGRAVGRGARAAGQRMRLGSGTMELRRSA